MLVNTCYGFLIGLQDADKKKQKIEENRSLLTIDLRISVPQFNSFAMPCLEIETALLRYVKCLLGPALLRGL